MVVGPAVGPRVTSSFPSLSHQLNRTSKGRRSSHQPNVPPPLQNAWLCVRGWGRGCGEGAPGLKGSAPIPAPLQPPVELPPPSAALQSRPTHPRLKIRPAKSLGRLQTRPPKKKRRAAEQPGWSREGRRRRRECAALERSGGASPSPHFPEGHRDGPGPCPEHGTQKVD